MPLLISKEVLRLQGVFLIGGIELKEIEGDINQKSNGVFIIPVSIERNPIHYFIEFDIKIIGHSLYKKFNNVRQDLAIIIFELLESNKRRHQEKSRVLEYGKLSMNKIGRLTEYTLRIKTQVNTKETYI